MTPPLSVAAAPPVRDHLAWIDFARAAAILLVVGFHLLLECFGGPDALASRLSLTDGDPAHFLLALLPFSYGYTGVAVFFFISGFCIHLSFESSRAGGFRTFYLRRFFRIYPPYFVALCFFGLLFPATRLHFDSALNIAQFGSHLLMLHNLDHRSFYGINAAFWSLGVEVQLYLIYPLLLGIVRRWSWNGALLVAGVIELALRTAMTSVSSLPYWFTASPFSYWFSWSIGAFVADQYLNRRPQILARWPWWIWLVPLVAASRLADFFVFPCVALLTGALMARGISRSDAPAPDRTGWISRALQAVGVGSYSLYLLHQPLLAAGAGLLRTAFPGQTLPPAAMATGLCLLSLGFIPLCWLFYRGIELPGIRLGKKITRQMAAGPVAARPPASV